MPGPYNFELGPEGNGFDYQTLDPSNPVGHLDPGGKVVVENACQAKALIQAFQAANPDKGVSGKQESFDALEEECPSDPNAVNPQPSSGTPPVDANPVPGGGDSADKQGAPTPPVGITATTPPPTDNPAPTDEPKRPDDGMPDIKNGGEKPQKQTNGGDPVDIFNGAFYLSETDLTIPNTILPLAFTRVYRSGTPSFNPFGWNWDHNFNLYLRELATGDIALWRNLHEDLFKFDGVDFQPPSGVFEKLERTSGLSQTYQLTADGGTMMYFEMPGGWLDAERIPITRLEDRHGNMLTFTYQTDGKLSEVRDDDDRFFRFDYDQCGLLVRVSDNSGRQFDYEHDEETMHLIRVKSPAINNHPDGIVRIYHYEDRWELPELRHNIVRVEDSEGNVYLENAYDKDPASWSYARIIEQLYGGYLYQYQYTVLQMVPPNSVFINIPALRVEMMDPDFGLETYTFNYRGDLLDQRYRLTKDKSFRVVVWQYAFDDQGNLTKITKPDGAEILSVYDSANPDPRMRGKLLQKELTSAAGFPAPSRIIWKGSYEPAYQLLLEERDEYNRPIKYKYDFDLSPGAPTNTGKLKEIIHPDTTLPDGSAQTAKTTFEHTPKGQLTATHLPDGTINKFEYGAAGVEKNRLVKQLYDTTGVNILQTMVYDTVGNNTTRIDGNGNALTQVYNALGLVERSVLPAVNGLTTEYIVGYDSNKSVVSFERPKGQFSDGVLAGTHIQDTFARDVLGYATKFSFSTNTGEQRSVTLCNDFRGFPTELINQDGSRVKRKFDERGLLLSEQIVGIDDITLTLKKTYDRTGKLMQETDPYGLTTKYDYDGFSRLAKTILPGGTEIKNTWLKKDLIESEEVIGDDGTGTVRQLSFTRYEYDEKGRRTQEIVKNFTDNPAVSVDVVTTYFYDALDRVVKIKNHQGGEMSKQYDGLGRLVRQTDFMGNEEHYTYDGSDNLVQQDSHHIEPDGSTSVISQKFGYDERNRRIESIAPDGSKATVEYDDRNLVVKETDPLAIVKETFYNSFQDKIREVYDPVGLNITHQWIVDNMSRITKYIDPALQESYYYHDSVGRRYKVQYANGLSSSKTFNASNQVIKEALGSGVEFMYDYDAANRIRKITNTSFPSVIKTDDHEFTYDGLGRVVKARVGSRTIGRRYDSLGRLIAESAPDGIVAGEFDDAASQMKKIWPDGRTEKISFDLNGALAKIEETVSGSLGSGLATLATIKTSGPVAIGEYTYHAGAQIENRYDDRKRLVEVMLKSPVGANENIKYRYNKADQKQVEALQGQNPRINYFELDQKQRVIKAKDGFTSTIPNAATQADHDAAINQVKTDAAAATHEEGFAYNGSDERKQYTETGNPAKNYTYLPGHKIQNDGTNAYAYSSDGVLKDDGVLSYEADALGRIVKIKSGASTITEIAYDALGRPSVVKENGKPDKSFSYFGKHLVQENESGVASKYISVNPANGVPLAYHMAAGTFYTIIDGRYNMSALMDTGGKIVETYRYKSFGMPQIYNAANVPVGSSAFGVDPMFGGQRYLAGAGLYLSTQRLMNPVNGVFLTGDPRGYLDSSSIYVYVRQSPIDLIDPDGEFAFLAILAVMAIGAVIAGGLNAVRQGIAIAEGSQKEFEWGQLGLSIGIGAVAAPLLVFAPELAVPLAAWGVYGGVSEISKGHYGTGAFDIVTSLAPFGFKNARSATFGKGSAYAGLSETATMSQRAGRFTTIQNNITNYVPPVGGKNIGVGFAPMANNASEGHVAVVFDDGNGSVNFMEKNATRLFKGAPLWADFNTADSLPSHYYPDSYGTTRPFSYEWVKIPRWNWTRAMNYGTGRTSTPPLSEPFAFDGQNCSNFVGDVLGNAGISGVSENSSAGAMGRNFSSFAQQWPNLVASGYSAPFFTSGLQPGTASAAEKK